MTGRTNDEYTDPLFRPGWASERDRLILSFLFWLAVGLFVVGWFL